MTARLAELSDAEDSDLVRMAREGLLRLRLPGWRVYLDDLWCHVRPVQYTGPSQGWKLHLSATARYAREVLGHALPVLLEHRCPFKFTSTIDRLELVNSAHYPRGGSGKFLTVYPAGDEQFRVLAAQLDAGTAHCAGPRILSDRRLRPDSLVHFRYGGFTRNETLTNDAQLLPVLTDPDGQSVPDRREAWFAPPSWAVAPLPAETVPADRLPPPAGASGPPGVLLGGGYLARQAIRHSNRGGVYRATAVATGTEVIVKQARRHVLGNGGLEATAALAHEAEVLQALGPTGRTPAVLASFHQDGDLFVVSELVAGVPLGKWVRQRISGDATRDEPGTSWSELAHLTRELVDLVEAVHDQGWVIRDLTPSNVIVTPNGALRLVDLEFAARSGDRPRAGGTPGFLAPEQAAGAPADPAADRYALGCLVFLLATGIHPSFAADRPARRSQRERMAQRLALLSCASTTARCAWSIVEGLTAAAPGDRWSGRRVREYLAARPRPRPRPRPDHRAEAGPSDVDALLADGLAYLCSSMTPESSERLWPAACAAGGVDPCNVQHGAAGVLSVLVRALECGIGVPGLRPAVREAADWLCRRMEQLPRTLPGLYFGRSGTAWALWQAATALDDGTLADRAVDLALRVPVRWPNPDVTHGAAGAGLAQIYFWRATGDPRFRQRLVTCAEGVAGCAERRDGLLDWRVPETFESQLAGLSHYGFAHGVAGIGYFLLCAGRVTTREDFVALARQAGDTLEASAVLAGGGALWPAAATGDTGPLEHWCSGSAGVGTFLVRLWRATGCGRYLELARAAALAAWRRRWYATPIHCHGLAGTGQFLLDLVAVPGCAGPYDPRQIAALIDAAHADRDGRRLIPDETGTGFGCEYGVGMSGALDFLLRLRYGGPRAWMVEESEWREPST